MEARSLGEVTQQNFDEGVTLDGGICLSVAIVQLFTACGRWLTTPGRPVSGH